MKLPRGNTAGRWVSRGWLEMLSSVEMRAWRNLHFSQKATGRETWGVGWPHRSNQTLVPTRSKMVSLHDIGSCPWVMTQAAGLLCLASGQPSYPLLSGLNRTDSDKIQIVRRLQSSSLPRRVQSTQEKLFCNVVIVIRRPFVGTLNTSE